MTTYTATAQDGSKHTRNSEKSIAYAIVGTWGKPGELHGVLGWHATLQLAQNKLAVSKKPIMQQRYPNAIWEIVEVEVAA